MHAAGSFRQRYLIEAVQVMLSTACHGQTVHEVGVDSLDCYILQAPSCLVHLNPSRMESCCMYIVSCNFAACMRRSHTACTKAHCMRNVTGLQHMHCCHVMIRCNAYTL